MKPAALASIFPKPVRMIKPAMLFYFIFSSSSNSSFAIFL